MKKKCAILLDRNNNWIGRQLNDTTFEKFTKYKFKIFYDYKKIKDFDIVFILGYTKILAEKFIKKNNISLTIHNSNLPFYRGFSPLQQQILSNKKKIGMCLIKVVKEVDRGPIILKDFLRLDGTELYNEIREKQFILIVKLIKKFLKKFPNITLKSQPNINGSFFKRRKASDQKLDITKSIKNQFNLMRIANNEDWPCYFEFKNKRYILKIYQNDKRNS